MKLTVKVPTEIDAAFIRVNIPVRYANENIPADFPFRRPWREGDTGGVDSRRYDRWDVTIAVDNGRIQGWPAGRSESLHMKVCDEGVYTLLNHAGEPMAEVFEDYVPDCVPGKYGDYVEMTIGPDGTIAEWAGECLPEGVRAAFYPEDDD